MHAIKDIRCESA